MDFSKEFDPFYGEAVKETDWIERVTVRNPGPFTFYGTNSYVLGKSSVAVIDPGPDDDNHLEALLRTVGDRPVTHIIVSHTHVDHSPLARRLSEITGAKIYAEGPHRPARPLRLGEINPLDASADIEFKPDIELADGDEISGEGWTLQAIHTPGHTANHAVFSFLEENILFSADHVMAWATSIVAPPDGAMADYMSSLRKLFEREEHFYLPGHGGRVENPKRFVRALLAHRITREQSVMERLKKGDRRIPDIVREIYRDIDPKLHGAAALSMLAHMEDLVSRGVVETEDEISLEGTFYPK